MAGWDCKDAEVIEWDGTIKAKRYQGDGSALTGITPAGGGGSLWTSGAEHIYPVVGTQIISGAGFTTAGTISGAQIIATDEVIAINNISIAGGDSDVEWSLGYTHSIGNGMDHSAVSQTSTAFVSLSGAYYAYLPIDMQTSASLKSLSSSYFTHIPQFDKVSGSLVSLSSSYFTHIPQFDKVSGSLVSLSSAFNTTFMPQFTKVSGSLVSLSSSYFTHIPQFDKVSGSLVSLSGAFVNLSGAYNTHAADATDPHTTYLQQTSLAITGDHTTSAAAYCVNVIMASTATPPTASTYPQGTIYLQYTA
jgi:hypothetical protein